MDDDEDGAASPREERRGGGSSYEREREGDNGARDRNAMVDDEDEHVRGKESMEIEADDAAFVLGRGGATKKKIERACGAMIDLNEREYRIDVMGTKRQRKLAMDYLKYVMQQRVGPVQIDVDEPRDDLTVLTVPDDCVAFVMGRAGQTLRMIEEEWLTLMFFAKMAVGGQAGSGERLMIFGDLRARRGAELKVMSAVEHKKPGHFVRMNEHGQPEDLKIGERFKGDVVPPDADWAIDTIPLSNDDFSYALGAQGSTRRKLAKASGAVLEYVGMLACIAGYKPERRRCRDYLRLLLKQRTGPVHVEHEGRDDVTAVQVPPQSVGFITGSRGETLRHIERLTGTFCFTSSASPTTESGGRHHETLLIFGHDPRTRMHAREEVEERIRDHARLQAGGGPRGGFPGPPGGYGGGGGGGGRYDDRRDRYDDRDRDRGYDRDRRDDRRDDSRRYDDRRDRDYDRDRDRDYRRDERRYDDRDRDRYDDRDRGYDRDRRDDSRRYEDRDRRRRDDEDRDRDRRK